MKLWYIFKYNFPLLLYERELFWQAIHPTLSVPKPL
jgi:hypothetical protein